MKHSFLLIRRPIILPFGIGTEADELRYCHQCTVCGQFVFTPTVDVATTLWVQIGNTRRSNSTQLWYNPDWKCYGQNHTGLSNHSCLSHRLVYVTEAECFGCLDCDKWLETWNTDIKTVRKRKPSHHAEE